MFERSVADIAEQIESNAQIQTTTLSQSLQRLQQIQNQFQVVHPLMTTIAQELTELELSGLAKSDLQTLLTTFESHRKRINA